MSSQKTTTKQERFELVSRFLQSGQSLTVWCQENGIKPATFYRWRMEYKTVQHDVCFVPLQSKASKRVHLTPKEEMINKKKEESKKRRVWIVFAVLSSVFSS